MRGQEWAALRAKCALSMDKEADVAIKGRGKATVNSSSEQGGATDRGRGARRLSCVKSSVPSGACQSK